MKRKIAIGCGLLILTPIIGIIISLAWVYSTYGNIDSNTITSLIIGSKMVRKKSPNGKLYLEAEVWRRKDSRQDAYLYVFLRIYHESGELIQEINTRANGKFPSWDVEWKDDETIGMYSSEIGHYEYTRYSETSWERSP